MKKILIHLLFLIITFPVFSTESTETMLDNAIEEFSKENYDRALEIIDMVLINEPDNSVALDYKKTIKEISEINTEEETVLEVKDVPSGEKKVIGQKITEEEDRNKKEVLSLSTYIGNSSDNKLILEQGAKIILGIPMVEFITRTVPMNYNVTKLSNDLPTDEFKDIDNYSFDFGLGIRTTPFKERTDNGGWADIKIGATGFTNIDLVVPYIGFDSELHLLSAFGDNMFFNSFWIGGRGKLYIHNDKIVNNYFIQGKAGFEIGFFDIGAFYGVANMETFETEVFNQTFYGLKLGFSF